MLRQLGITQGLALWTLHPIDLSRVLLAVALQLLRGVPRRAARLLRLGPRLRRLVRGRVRVLGLVGFLGGRSTTLMSRELTG